MNMNEAQLQEIFSDKEFVLSLFDLETSEDVKSSLAAKGLELTVDEIEVIKGQLLKGDGTSLSDCDLEDVAGGFAITAGMLTVIGIVSTCISAGAGGAVFVDKVTNRRW